VNSQGNTEKKEQWWQYDNTQLQTIPQSHSDTKQHGIGTKTDMKTSGTK
jgi:hypothetical protein